MEIKKTKIKDILLNKMENIKTLTKTRPDNVRLTISFIIYRSSNNSKYRFFEFVLP